MRNVAMQCVIATIKGGQEFRTGSLHSLRALKLSQGVGGGMRKIKRATISLQGSIRGGIQIAERSLQVLSLSLSLSLSISLYFFLYVL